MNNLLEGTRKIYNDYPRAFWTYNIIVFIDRLGGFMLYPFFALYLTQKFDIGMSTVGILFAIFSVSGFVGSVLGGALTDRMGRRGGSSSASCCPPSARWGWDLHPRWAFSLRCL